MVKRIFERAGKPAQPKPVIAATAPVQPSLNERDLPEDFWHVDEAAVLQPPPHCAYEIALDTFFNARHHVFMEGRTGLIHTHCYRLQICCRSRILIAGDHTVVSYRPLRERLQQTAQAYNNRLLNDLPPFQQLQPTTENLTAVLFQQLQRMLADLPVEVINVTVWESPTEAITYRAGQMER